MTTEVTIDEVSFKTLQESCPFLLVTKGNGGSYHLERFVYRKHTWKEFNAIQDNYDGEACNHGWTTFEEDQLVFPLV